MAETLLHIAGARPNFPKAAPVIRALALGVPQQLVHTGQHYDERMSEVFFRQLDLPEPDVNLEWVPAATPSRPGHHDPARAAARGPRPPCSAYPAGRCAPTPNDR